MLRPVGLWLCLSLLLTDGESVERPAGRGAALRPGAAPHRPLAEMLDLDVDRNRRLARGADEEEQQSTFGQSFENDSLTAPRATEFANGTEAGAGDDVGRRGNASDPPGLFNPFYPPGAGSHAAYGVLLLAGLLLAVGVVGNMAVMCVVWNNYYMRSAWNYLLASVAFWDFLVLVLCLPVVVLNQLSHRRILGDVTCRMVPYMEVGGACVEGGGGRGSECLCTLCTLCTL